jgi:hypothetical protein
MGAKGAAMGAAGTTRRTATVAAVSAIVTVVAMLGIRSATAVTTTVAADEVTRVKTLRSDAGSTRTGNANFATLPGAETTIFVPQGTKALILARFTGESNCSGGQGWCTVRILIGGLEAHPAAGKSFAFDGATMKGEYASHAVERLRGPLGPGTYQVKVQWAISQENLSFWLDDWLLVIERATFR